MLKTLQCLPLVAVLVALTMTGQAAETSYNDVAGIFQARCVMCHSGPHAPLDLRLDSLEHILKGSKNGPVVAAGSPKDSELVRRITGLSQPRMPMTGPPFLADQEIALIESWVDSDLQADTSPPPVPVVQAVESQALVTYSDIAPILLSRCAKCHADNGLMGPAPEGYLLTTYEGTLSPRDRVRVVPGYPQVSELMRRLTGQSLPRMPFDGPPFLEVGDVDLIAKWIAQGALSADKNPAPYPVGARIRLQGTLVAVWQLDEGLPLHVDAATRLDKSPEVGDYVEVRGRLVDDGEIAIERIRRR